MNPLAMLILAILTPFLMITALLVPPYAGIYGASYIIYDKGAAVHPLAGRYDDVFYIIDVFAKLLDYWMKHMETLSVVHYSLPIVGLPLTGLILGLWLTRRIMRKMKDIFHLSVSN